MSLNIVVCIKQVPVNNNLKIDPKTKNVLRTNELGVMNPFDKNAIEAALRLKEQVGANITLISMGPENFAHTLREGLAMGCDHAILLSSRAFSGADTLATGYVLSQAIKQLGNIDIVLFGRQSVDADTGQVGPIVAEFLDVSQVTYISELKYLGNKELEVTRLMEHVKQKLFVKLPVVLSVRNELNTPRYPSPKNIKNSFKKTIEVWDDKKLVSDSNMIGIKGSKTIVRSVWSPEKQEKNAINLGDNAHDAVRKLLVILKSKNIL